MFLLPAFDPQPREVTFKQRAKNFDFVGAILSIASIICLVMAINFGDALYPWKSGQIIGLFCASFVLLLIFAVQQNFSWFTTVEERMFPCHLLKVKEANLLFVATACCNAAGFLPIYYIPIYFQFSRGDDALQAAVRLLPLIILLSVTIIAQGYLMSKLGYYYPWYVVGGALLLAGDVLLASVDENTRVAKIYGYEILIAIGAGAFIQAGYATIQTVVAPADTSYAIAFMMLAQFIGIVFGLSIGGAIFINEGLKSLHTLLPDLTDAQLRGVLSGTSSHAVDVVPEALRAQALSAIVDSLQKLFIPAYVAAAIAFIVSIFLKVSVLLLQVQENE